MTSALSIPIALFTYARPDHLRRTLECLRQNSVPLIYAFSDGPRSPEKFEAVNEVRQMLRAIDWCEVVLCERGENLGLGRSILTGVGEVLERHEAVIVFEDDLICVPGTYEYLCAALERYRSDDRVMSVTGWTHPRVTPSDVGDMPYFDGRAECWVWGTWARSWDGMDKDAQSLIRECRRYGIDPYQYGADLIRQAENEHRLNTWAVRFLYLHMRRGQLCLRPPWTMVEHIGFDSQATNFNESNGWENPLLGDAPSIPELWPTPKLHGQCAMLWQAAAGKKPNIPRRVLRKVKRTLLRLTGKAFV